MDYLLSREILIPESFMIQGMVDSRKSFEHAIFISALEQIGCVHLYGVDAHYQSFKGESIRVWVLFCYKTCESHLFFIKL